MRSANAVAIRRSPPPPRPPPSGGTTTAAATTATAAATAAARGKRAARLESNYSPVAAGATARRAVAASTLATPSPSPSRPRPARRSPWTPHSCSSLSPAAAAAAPPSLARSRPSNRRFAAPTGPVGGGLPQAPVRRPAAGPGVRTAGCHRLWHVLMLRH